MDDLTRAKSRVVLNLLALSLAGWASACSSQDVANPSATDPSPDPPLTSPRLYVMDCGIITAMDPESYDLRPEEISGSLDFFTPCYLVEHPEGTLLWDLGQIPDADFPDDGSTASQGVFLAEQPLLPQLAEIGYEPSEITFVAMSHYHGDHSANANSFREATWIVQRAEREAMFAEEPALFARPERYDLLENAATVLLEGEDHDVFGDGTVVIKSTPGHTPGHQSLFVDLANTGPTLLSGDLYHYVEERTLDRVPGFDFDQDVTRESRRQVEQFLIETGAQLWIQHDLALNNTLAKSPEYYD